MNHVPFLTFNILAIWKKNSLPDFIFGKTAKPYIMQNISSHTHLTLYNPAWKVEIKTSKVLFRDLPLAILRENEIGVCPIAFKQTYAWHSCRHSFPKKVTKIVLKISFHCCLQTNLCPRHSCKPSFPIRSDNILSLQLDFQNFAYYANQE